MPVFDRHPHGQFCWVDLTARNVVEAVSFYGDLFGWTLTRLNQPGAPEYGGFLQDGQVVAGIGQMSVEMMEAGLPAMWNNYVSVDDCAAVEARARDLGAQVLVPTTLAEGSGRLCFFADPQGSTLAAWEARGHPGVGLCNEPASLCWNELITQDMAAIRPFYADLFGWTLEDGEAPGGDPGATVANQGRDQAHLREVGEAWEGLPPQWLACFAVADLGATLLKAEVLGATLIGEPMETPRGRFAAVIDKHGAGFCVFEYADGHAGEGPA